MRRSCITANTTPEAEAKSKRQPRYKRIPIQEIIAAKIPFFFISSPIVGPIFDTSKVSVEKGRIFLRLEIIAS